MSATPHTTLEILIEELIGTITELDISGSSYPGPILKSIFDFSSSGSNTLVAGVAAKVIRVHGIILQSNGSTALTLKSDSTAISHVMNFVNRDVFTLDKQKEEWFITATAEDLNLSLSASVQVTGTLYYTQI